jgi:gliding motility-associated-like protein
MEWFNPDTISIGTGETVTVNPLFTGGMDGNDHRSEHNYRVVATFCGHETEVIVPVYVDEPLMGEILGDSIICEGNRTTLDASPYQATIYLWTSEDSLAEQRVGHIWNVMPTTATYYKVEMTRGECSGDDRFLVEIASLPRILFIDSIGYRDRKIVVDEDYGTPPFYYGVDSESVDEYAEKYNLRISTHTFRVVDDLGCKSEVVSYTLIAPPLIFPPYFSPNGDGVNDTWEVTGLGNYYPDARVTLYDRFGKQLVEYGATDTGWDGTYLGNAMPTTDYWYVVSSADLDKEYVGHFTLFRK